MLVALSVVAVSLSAIGSLIAVTMRGARSVGGHLALVETARSIITGLPDRGELGPGSFSGEAAGHRWRVDVLPFYADFVDPQETDWMPQTVVVRVQSPSGPILQINTVRLRRSAAAMSTRAKRRRRIAGFTLVEALLATALMGVILAAIATVTAQWLPNWNRGFERVQRVEALALGLERIVADLAAAEFVTAGANIRQPVFDGTELSVTFLRTALGPNTRPGLELVRIQEIGSEKGLMTVRQRARFLPMGRDGIKVQARPRDPVVLVRAPYRVTFAYAGPDRVWRNVWRGEGTASRGDPRAAARCRDRPHALGLDRDARPCRDAGRLHARRGDRRLPQPPPTSRQQPSG